jgi:Asp-tRNA(Asn)/Glu-tRNA(Gln) amidotransferase C subunit
MPSIRTFNVSALGRSSQHCTPENVDVANRISDEQYLPKNKPISIESLLSRPTWSVRSLLPDPNTPTPHEITAEKLHHLLRLSALPQPKTREAEADMLDMLHSQLHFVRDVGRVDTDGVEPLQSIRDETTKAVRESTIGLEQMGEELSREQTRGRGKRPRRARENIALEKGVEDWDVLGAAADRVVTPGGTYFVVRSGGEDSHSHDTAANKDVAEKSPQSGGPSIIDVP